MNTRRVLRNPTHGWPISSRLGNRYRHCGQLTCSVQLINNCSELGPLLCQRMRTANRGGILFPAISQRIGLRNLRGWLISESSSRVFPHWYHTYIYARMLTHYSRVGGVTITLTCPYYWHTCTREYVYVRTVTATPIISTGGDIARACSMRIHVHRYSQPWASNGLTLSSGQGQSSEIAICAAQPMSVTAGQSAARPGLLAHAVDRD